MGRRTKTHAERGAACRRWFWSDSLCDKFWLWVPSLGPGGRASRGCCSWYMGSPWRPICFEPLRAEQPNSTLIGARRTSEVDEAMGEAHQHVCKARPDLVILGVFLQDVQAHREHVPAVIVSYSRSRLIVAVPFVNWHVAAAGAQSVRVQAHDCVLKHALLQLEYRCHCTGTTRTPGRSKPCAAPWFTHCTGRLTEVRRKNVKSKGRQPDANSAALQRFSPKKCLML